METVVHATQCPRCNSMKVTGYGELNEDQQFLIERLPDFEDLSMSEIRSSRFCTKCWYRRSAEAEQLA